MLHGIVSRQRNNNILWWGMAICLSFPQIGYFDERNYKIYHGIISGVFFLSTCVYANKLAHAFKKHRNEFKDSYQGTINLMNTLASIMKWMIIIFAISLIGLAPAVWEWILALLYLNYFAFTAFINPFYDSVLDPRKDSDTTDDASVSQRETRPLIWS